ALAPVFAVVLLPEAGRAEAVLGAVTLLLEGFFRQILVQKGEEPVLCLVRSLRQSHDDLVSGDPHVREDGRVAAGLQTHPAELLLRLFLLAPGEVDAAAGRRTTVAAEAVRRLGRSGHDVAVFTWEGE